MLTPQQEKFRKAFHKCRKRSDYPQCMSKMLRKKNGEGEIKEKKQKIKVWGIGYVKVN